MLHPLDELGERLGIVLREPELIRQAFVHSSYFNENPDLVSGHNERLEFYGDAVIGLTVSRLLYERYPDEDEGFLTARRAALVNRDALAAHGAGARPRPVPPARPRRVRCRRRDAPVAAGRLLRGARRRALAERGDRAHARPCSARLFEPRLEALAEIDGPPKSAKSRLQEWTQRHRGVKPIYQLDRHQRARRTSRSSSVAVALDGDALGAGRRLEPAARGGAGRRRGARRRGSTHDAAPRGGRVMSRLKELRLHGFKSFADPTRFVFEPGVNAVIGPNGSGKSNMADAVRWVLGEQSNRSLRTRRADDVIFAGSEQRKPQGMAEAVLTLDNADGWLPIDFAEVIDRAARLSLRRQRVPHQRRPRPAARRGRAARRGPAGRERAGGRRAGDGRRRALAAARRSGASCSRRPPASRASR